MLWVQGPAVFSFFAADDLVHLQQAAGIIPTPHQPWRVLTQVLYFRAMYGLVGPSSIAFMIVNLLLHALNMGLVFGLLTGRGAHVRVAGLATALFGACPLLAIVIGHAVVIDDIAALTFALLALRGLAGHDARARLLGVASYTVAMLCKESVMFLPLLAAWPRPGAPPRERMKTLGIAAAIVSVFAVLYSIAHGAGLGPGGAPYALSPFPAPIHNLMTYTRWFVSLHTPIPDLIRAPDPSAWRVGLPVLATMALVAWRVPRARGEIGLGLAWWIVGLAPVLGLEHSAYPHYLYVALPGIALSTAAVLDSLIERLAAPIGRGSTTRNSMIAATITAIVIVTYGLRGQQLAVARFGARLPGIDLPLDPQIRAMTVGARAVSSLADRITADTRRLAIVTPSGLRRVFGTQGKEYESSPDATVGYDLQREVLSDGRALRVFFPQLDSVVYVERWSRRLREFDMAERAPTGEIVLHGRSLRGHLELVEAMRARGASTAATEYLDSLRVAYPDSLVQAEQY
jgi:hypothetical protein